MELIIDEKRLIRGPGKSGGHPVTFGSSLSITGQRFTLQGIDYKNKNNVIVHLVGWHGAVNISMPIKLLTNLELNSEILKKSWPVNVSIEGL